jgi:1-acyl-sn-glycerol-3-phosphate acyltransferase
MMAFLRTFLKFVGFLLITARALTDYFLKVGRRGGALRERAEWCHRWAVSYLRLLNVEVTVRGTPPKAGLLACNHLSYLDILVLGGANRQIFLSKAEVRNWPIIGALTRCAGTLFVRRDRKADVAELQNSFANVVGEGLPITIFPEGTSSDGSRVLPFFSSLLEPAAKENWPVTPGWIGYRLEEGQGNVADDICYWRDMTFGPHFLKLLSKKKIYATVVFGEAIEPGLNRKQMAASLHKEVSALAAEHREFAPAAGDFDSEDFEPSFNAQS